MRHALPIRGDVRVLGLEGDDHTVLTLATGIGGLRRAQLPGRAGTPRHRPRHRASHGPPGVWCPPGEPVAACVSPANVPSLRALLRAGFDPVGSVQVYLPQP